MSSTSNRSRKRKEPTRRSERIAKLETQFPHIPDEILVTILSKLPVKSLLRFRCVSKRWGSLITDPKFCLSTPKQQAIVVSRNFSMECFFHLINDEALSVEVPKPKQLNGRGRRKVNRGLTIRGSCNGLVLLSNTEELFLWNPSTRCCKKVLSHKHLATFDRNQNASGLCYDSSTDDYKVVMACWRRSRERDGDKVMVGSFRNKTWTEVCWPYDKRHAKSGPTVNERLHLLVSKSTSDTEEIFDLPVGFDQRTNEFVEVPMPQSKQGKPVLGFGALDGCLSLTLGTDWRHLSQIDAEVFVMKKYSDQASWTRLFVISSADIRQCWSIWVPLCSTKNAEVLLLPELPFRTRIAVTVYNQKLNFWREEQMGPKKIRIYDTKGATFVESLVAPPYYNWEEEEEYTEIFLSGLTKRWKREQGDVAFKVIDS